MFVRVSFCNDNMLQLHDELEISRSCDTAVDEGAVGVNNHTEKSKLYLNPLLKHFKNAKKRPSFR